jgi:hypothetical protein
MAQYLFQEHLEMFKNYLMEVANIPYREGKGDYQVLQILNPDTGWQVIHKTKKMPDAFQVEGFTEKLVRKFYEDKRMIESNWKGDTGD